MGERALESYQYVGYDSGGKKVNGEVQAVTLEEAERRLNLQAVSILSIKRSGKANRESERQANSKTQKLRKISAADTAGILRNLAVMTETGVTFLDGLDATIEGARTETIRQTLELMRAEVVQGKSLAKAMRACPNMFTTIVCDIVKVAEEGGRLDLALGSAATLLERQAELRKRVLQAMLYPAVMGVVSVATILILILFVMPKFAEIFIKMKADVPATTKFMLGVGEFIRHSPLLAVLYSIGFVFAVRYAFTFAPVREGFSKLLWRIPVLGPLLNNLALSRAFLAIATLIKSNVPLMVALEHGARVTGSRRIEGALMAVRTDVEHGSSFSEALKRTGAFPPSLVQVVAIGEKSGRLAPLLETTAQRLEVDVDAKLKSLVSVVEPLMIVVMGTIIGTITISVISPIYSVVQNIK